MSERFDCGHVARVKGCGGCDPGAIEFVKDDGGPWRKVHDCDSCAACLHDGRKCCGCYDGACCESPEWADWTRLRRSIEALDGRESRGAGA